MGVIIGQVVCICTAPPGDIVPQRGLGSRTSRLASSSRADSDTSSSLLLLGTRTVVREDILDAPKEARASLLPLAALARRARPGREVPVLVGRAGRDRRNGRLSPRAPERR